MSSPGTPALARTSSLRSPSAPVPFELAAVQAGPDWAARIAWPVTLDETFAQGVRLGHAMIEAVNAAPDDEARDTLLLAAGALNAAAAGLAEAALAVERAQAAGWELAGSAPLLRFLLGEDEAARAFSGEASVRLAAAPRHAWARRLARTASWSTPASLLRSLWAPEAVALGHNPLLRDVAKTERRAIAFVHAESLYAEIVRRAAAREAPGCGRALAQELARRLAAAAGVEGAVGARLARLIEGEAERLVARAANELAAARQLKNVPLEVWAGSGGQWPGRCLGLEVLRRSGRVRRFDHGASAGTGKLVEPIVLTELSVCSAFTAATPALARRLAATGAARCIVNRPAPEIGGGYGDPHIRAHTPARAGARPMRPRLLYGPTIFRGQSPHLPPLLPDPVHLDWQVRLVTMLQALPVELRCRPHPEGLLKGRPHPLRALLPLCAEPFETYIAETDVFVFDYAQSTTFPIALCTDRPVVLIDFGLPVYDEEMWALLERRCRIVPARFDVRNRPQVDAEALVEAVCSGPAQVDAGECRTFFLGRP